MVTSALAKWAISSISGLSKCTWKPTRWYFMKSEGLYVCFRPANVLLKTCTQEWGRKAWTFWATWIPTSSVTNRSGCISWRWPTSPRRACKAMLMPHFLKCVAGTFCRPEISRHLRTKLGVKSESALCVPVETKNMSLVPCGIWSNLCCTCVSPPSEPTHVPKCSRRNGGRSWS